MISYDNHFEKIYILDSVKENPVTEKILKALAHLPVKIVGDKKEIPEKDMNQHTLFLSAPKASIFGPCPGTHGHLCCNYYTIDLYGGCTLGCTYCIMKFYLNFSPIIVNVDIEKTIAEVTELAAKHPDREIRVGTGEVGDSLLYDPLFELSKTFIRAFAPYPNIQFELKTKTDYVDHLLDIPEKGRAVIGFSVNTTSIIASEDGNSCTLAQRLEAAQKASSAGYRIAFHFDPIFHYKGWQRDYLETVRALTVIPPEKIAWISLGTFRYPNGLKEKIEQRWYLYDEFVPCKDKKFRYLQKIRAEIYKTIARELEFFLPGAKIYLCMESSTLWEKVFEKKPGKIDHLCTIFSRVKN